MFCKCFKIKISYQDETLQDFTWKSGLTFQENEEVCLTRLAFPWGNKTPELVSLFLLSRCPGFPTARSSHQDTLLLYALPWGMNFWPEALELSFECEVALFSIYTCLIFIFLFDSCMFIHLLSKDSFRRKIICTKGRLP